MISLKIDELEERTEQMLHSFEQGVTVVLQQVGFTHPPPPPAFDRTH